MKVISLNYSLPEVVLVPDSLLADPGRDEGCGSHVKCRVPDTEAVTELEAREELSSRPLLYRNVVTVRTASVQCGHRHADIKRDPDHFYHHQVITDM